MVTDKTGKFYEQIKYFPYGETWINNKATREQTSSPYKFTAKEYDEETGLYYYGARYYDAKLSRWISVDPPLARGDYFPSFDTFDTEDEDDWQADNDEEDSLPGMGGVFNTINMDVYHYASNNPVKLTDPDGEGPRSNIFCPDELQCGNGTLGGAGGGGRGGGRGYKTSGGGGRGQVVYKEAAKRNVYSPKTVVRNRSGNKINNSQVANGNKFTNTLKIIRETGRAPKGFKGGSTFANDGRGGGQVLPKKDAAGNPITYKEWDVNPYRKGVNRGAERIVTGSDGSAYYTNDHYKTFKLME